MPRPHDRPAPTPTLRVGHVLPWPTVGGVEIATLRIAESCEGSEISNIGFCLPEAQAVEELFRSAGFPTVTYQRPIPSLLRHGWPFWKQSAELARLLRQQRISLLHCSDLTSAPWVALAGKLARCAVLCHVRNRFEQVEEKLFLKPVDHFIFVSRDSWRRFGYPVSEPKGTVLYDGFAPEREIDLARAATNLRREFGIGASEIIIGMVARVAPQKDHETLLAAAQIVRQAYPRIRLLIVGDHASNEPYRHQYAKLRQIVAERGLDEICLFTGHRTDVTELMAGMDIFVLSTHHEGLPLVLLEAMSLGLPVIATEVDGIPEVVDNSTGVLVPHQDADRLAEAILAFARDPARRAAFSERARRRVQTQFSREQFAENVRRLYRRFDRRPVNA